MMRDEDKPFVCRRRGRWQFNIMPRNAEGWRLFAMWMVPLVLLTVAHVTFTARFEDNETLVGWVTVGFVFLVAVWALAMIRWMLDRSEVIWLDKGGRK